MAALLSIRDIVVIDWPDYEYFACNPNLLVTEGYDGNPEYSAEWWHERLTNIAAANTSSPATSHDFRFFGRLPDITREQALRGGFDNFAWEPDFNTPLPSSIAQELGISEDVYALSWPNNSRSSYAMPQSIFFAEVVTKLTAPPRLG